MTTQQTTFTILIASDGTRIRSTENNTLKLRYFDGNNIHTATVIRLRDGRIYGDSLSQWSNHHGDLEPLTVQEAVIQYRHALDDDDLEFVGAMADVQE